MTQRRGQVDHVFPIVKTIGKEREPDGSSSLKWIVANGYNGKMLSGPFDEEFQAFQSLKGVLNPPKKNAKAK